MAKLIYHIAVTVNYFIADSNGKNSEDFMKGWNFKVLSFFTIMKQIQIGYRLIQERGMVVLMRYIKIIFFSMFLSVMLINTEAHATSWAEVEPEEVYKEADVIVMGQYDFTSKPEGRNMLFTSYEFVINKVYQGDVSNKIRAGIDGYDVGWADEFQKDGGEFLLFLDKNKEFSYLTPVGGPNGMIQISDGKVQHHNVKSRVYYEEFLKKQTEKPIVKTSNEAVQNDDKNYTFLYVGLIVFFVCIGVFLVGRFRRTR